MIKMCCQPKTQDWNVGGFVEICGYNWCTGQTVRLKHVMGKLPAIAAVFAFLWVQFVHTAVLDATEPHDDFQAALTARPTPAMAMTTIAAWARCISRYTIIITWFASPVIRRW